MRESGKTGVSTEGLTGEGVASKLTILLAEFSSYLVEDLSCLLTPGKRPPSLSCHMEKRNFLSSIALGIIKMCKQRGQ